MRREFLYLQSDAKKDGRYLMNFNHEEPEKKDPESAFIIQFSSLRFTFKNHTTKWVGILNVLDFKVWDTNFEFLTFFS